MTQLRQSTSTAGWTVLIICALILVPTSLGWIAAATGNASFLTLGLGVVVMLLGIGAFLVSKRLRRL